MGPTGPDWLLPLAVLAAALALGTALVWRVSAAGRAAPVVPPEPVEVRDLRGKRDALLQQLRELEDTAAKRTPDQLDRERYALELEAARAWRALDGFAAPATATAKPRSARRSPEAAESAVAAPAPATRPALRGFLWGVGTMVAFGLLLFWVSRAATPREEGGSVTGNTPMEGGGPAPGAGTEEASLRGTLERSPDDLDARLDLARILLARQDMMAVWNETQYVLQRSPGHPRALAYQALVRLAMGQPDVAKAMLDEALTAQPDLLEGYLHLALVHTRVGRVKEAEAVLADALRRFPQHEKALERVAAEMRALGAEGAPALEGDPHAAVPPPGAGATPRGQADAPGAGRRLDVEVDLDPALRGQVAPGTLLFVIVREAGMEKGPPAAVKRLTATAFPVALALTEADSMAGEPIPAEVRIEARLDSDGDPVTRSPADPVARLDGVKVGSGTVRLVLRRAP